MNIGVPKEIKNSENRVAITPAGVFELKQRGHKVFIQEDAGVGAGFSNKEYEKQGAKIVSSANEVYEKATLIVKVKEPLEQEYQLIKSHHTVFTYFHFASNEVLTKAMIASGATCISYETVEKQDRSLPLLTPMSEVAGRMAIQKGANYLEKTVGGRGILMGGVPGVAPANVLILGGGVVGTQAAKMAAGLGANVTIMDVSIPRLRQLADLLPANVTTIFSNTYNIKNALKEADLVVGAVLIPGAKAPVLVSKDDLKLMKKGAVLIDVAVDQGGCIATCHPTTHENPVYVVDDILHYCVANMPGAVPITSTQALTNATLPFVVKLADLGWEEAIRRDAELKKGLNMFAGKICYQGVADAFGLEYTQI